METRVVTLLSFRETGGALPRWFGLLLASLCCVLLSRVVAFPAESLSPEELLQQLHQVTLDPDQVYYVRDVHLTRDRVQIYLNHGFVGLLNEVAGEVTGAVFRGEGEVLLMPPTVAEKRSLARFTGAPILEEPFTWAYFRFTDRTAEELRAAGRKPEPDDPEQPQHFFETWRKALTDPSPEFAVRILMDLLGDRSYPYFQVHVHGASLGPFAVAVDERHPEAVRVATTRRTRGELHTDIWCSFPSRLSEGRAESLRLGPAQVHSYRIETRILPDQGLEGLAQLQLESRSNTDAVLMFELSRHLKVESVKDDQGRSLVVFQNPSLNEAEVAARGNDWIVVLLPAPRPVGDRFRLDFTYRGNVITDAGNGVFHVGARGIWYPNRGWNMPAAYELIFHFPDRFTLVATGNCIEESVSGDMKYSRWISEGTFRVAGFNLGIYESSSRRLDSVTIEVHAAGKAEAALERRRAAFTPPPVELLIEPTGRARGPIVLVPRPVPPLTPSALLEDVTAVAARAVSYFQGLFGPFPYRRLAISQVPGRFGQGWPGLIYLPTLSFLSNSQREEVGLKGMSEQLYGEVILAHEIAHQWWGNHVGWQTYHDQWLSEGFASYAAALFLAQQKDGKRGFRELLRSYKQDLLGKTPEGDRIESGGPIWLGERLSNSLNPAGYDAIIYKKACWVLHMLRSLMRDSRTGSDENFFKMLSDFVALYSHKRASTQDFIRHAEKYMTRVMDLDRDRHLDWFFDQWVFNTGVPTYRLESKTRRLPSGKYAVEGTITQSDVHAQFEMLVPVVALYARGQKLDLGWVKVDDTGGRFRFAVAERPLRVAVDEDSILATVRD